MSGWLYDLIIQPLSFPFMRLALMQALAVGVLCAVLSCFLVLRGWSLMGDAVSHAVLPGIAIAYVLGLPLLLGAFAAGLFCAVAAGWLQANSRVKPDTVLGIVFSGMFALGLVLYVKIETDVHLDHILFGNVLGVTGRDVAETLLVGVPCLAFVLARRRDLLLVAFDAGHARAIGLGTTLLHYGLLSALALVIVISLKAVGVLLVVAMLIAPGAIGLLMTRRFDTMLAVAVAAAVFSCLAGTIMSFHLDAATGAVIVLVQAALFLLAVLLAPRRGLLRRRAALASA
jgi:manganese/iron transport system permease protein